MVGKVRAGQAVVCLRLVQFSTTLGEASLSPPPLLFPFGMIRDREEEEEEEDRVGRGLGNIDLTNI